MKSTNTMHSTYRTDWRFSVQALLAVSVVITFFLLLHLT